MGGIEDLRSLAQSYGIQVSHVDGLERRCTVAPESLMGVLDALGVPIHDPADAAEALRARRAQDWHRLIEPVTVAFGGERPTFELRLPERYVDARVTVKLETEQRQEAEWLEHLSEIPPHEKAELDGVSFVAKRIPMRRNVSFGYHRVQIQAGALDGTTMLIAAPEEASRWEGARAWGTFLPLYSLRTARDWGVGDLTDLTELMQWVGELGGRVVGTLPLLASFLDEPFEPSPYSPASRLFWNELYIDVERAPELARSDEGRMALSSPATRHELGALRRAGFVDYRRAIALKRSILEPFSRALEGERLAAVASNARRNEYARFRAATKAHGPWTAWHGSPAGDEAEARYHCYVQFLAEEQLTELDRTTAGGSTLMFDLPLGVHPHGYDTWRFRESFALGIDGGAPPDGFFSKGQNWRFPPLHPERVREQRYMYPVACLRHLLRHARVLRIDHVMAFHRLYWIPKGADADQGAYVRYRPDEFYAILCLESARAGALIVGEDLGTVPEVVRRTMRAHAIQRTYVVQEELHPEEEQTVGELPEDALATLNTHDMPPFAMFWSGGDIQRRVELGLFDEEEAAAERARREEARAVLLELLSHLGLLDPTEEPDRETVLRATLRALAGSRARIVMPSLEDLWGETEPQNTPGTGPERWNWQRKGKYTLEQLRELPEVVEMLTEIARIRQEL